MAFFGDVRAEVARVDVDAFRAGAEVRRGADCFVVLLRDREAALRVGFAVLRAPRAFGRAERPRAVDFLELWRDFSAGRDAFRVAFLPVLRPALRVPAFALRFAITSVLSVPQVFSRDDPRHP